MQRERRRCHCLQGVLSEGLRTQVEAAETVQALEDLYLPHRPKRTTKGAVRHACLMVSLHLPGSSRSMALQQHEKESVVA